MTSLRPRLNWATTALSTLLLSAYGCSAGPDDSGSGGAGGTINPGAGAGMGSGGLSVTPSTGSTNGGGGIAQGPVCDDMGNCVCIRLALMGSLDTAADNGDVRPFVDWLNNSSDGTAVATYVEQKPEITAEWLSQFNVLVTANLSSWPAFSEAEKAAVAEWVKAGGGLISLTGFNSLPAEPDQSAQLITWAGFDYTDTDTAPNAGQSVPVYYGDGTTDLKSCLFRSETEKANFTTPIEFPAQAGDYERLTKDLDYVGAYYGWGITGPAEAMTIATDPVTMQAMAMALQVDAGKIFVFGDEWVVLRNVWEHTAPTDDAKCALDAAAQAEYPGETHHSVRTLYQSKQFWFNAINWVGPNSCELTIDVIR